MLPVTPTKKALTDDMKNAIYASNAYRDNIVPEDLHVALQNLGSRVRKSVMEGFSTQHLTTFTVPATPHSSPVKLPGTQTTPTPTPTSMPVFLSANEAFVSVFPSGNNSSRVPLTPSPKKRTRADVDVEPNEDDSVFRNHDVDIDMDGRSEVADGQIPMGQEANTHVNMVNLTRKIKPLRRSVFQARMSAGGLSDPFAFTPHDVGYGSPAARDILMQGGGIEMEFSEEAQA